MKLITWWKKDNGMYRYRIIEKQNANKRYSQWYDRMINRCFYSNELAIIWIRHSVSKNVREQLLIVYEEKLP